MAYVTTNDEIIHTENVVFGIDDEKGRSTGAVVRVARLQAGGFASYCQATRDGESYGAAQNWKAAVSEEAALSDGRERAANTKRRYMKKYAVAA